MSNTVNLKCSCEGDRIICTCTARCNETILWLDNNVTFCSCTHIPSLTSKRNCSTTGCVEPVTPNECSSSVNFTSRLSFRMGSSADQQIGCFITPYTSVPGLRPSNDCSPMREPSVLQRRSCVTPCTGMYINIWQDLLQTGLVTV